MNRYKNSVILHISVRTAWIIFSAVVEGHFTYFSESSELVEILGVLTDEILTIRRSAALWELRKC